MTIIAISNSSSSYSIRSGAVLPIAAMHRCRLSVTRIHNSCCPRVQCLDGCKKSFWDKKNKLLSIFNSYSSISPVMFELWWRVSYAGCLPLIRQNIMLLKVFLKFMWSLVVYRVEASLPSILLKAKNNRNELYKKLYKNKTIYTFLSKLSSVNFHSSVTFKSLIVFKETKSSSENHRNVLSFIRKQRVKQQTGEGSKLN